MNLGIAPFRRLLRALRALRTVPASIARTARGATAIACLLAGAGLAALPASAQTLRIASAFDPQTMDPHGLALLYHTRVVSQVYESLVGRDEKFALEPALAASWQMTSPTAWRFRLRAGVVFHDGSRFTADDAVFSVERAMAPPSQRAFQLKGVKAVRKLDDATIEFQLEAPDAVLPEKLQYVAMMSRAWSEKNGAVRAQDFNARQEMHTVRNANGTGPFRLARYEPDVRLVLERHPGWWGWADPAHARRNGNLKEVQFLPIRSDATRLAALTSGEVDLVLDPPYQDIARLKADSRMTLAQTADIGQQYLTFDQARDELEFSDVKGRNPFKDLRVRRAVYHAINVPLIIDKVLRGQAVPTGAFLSPRVDGSPAELDVRLPFDPARSRALLAEAGYPNGFAVTLDCVNVAWRENSCQAMAAMLTQVGIRTTLRSSTTSQFFPRLSQGSASFVEFGWSASPDAWNSLNGLFRTFDRSGLGSFNAGRYSNPKLDTLIDQIRVEPDLTRRRAMVATVLRLVTEDLPYIPLYRRTLTWAMAKKVSVVQWPNDTLELRWAKVR
ncbi:MAG: ABC transporter substrate-binding protein [Rubrivivax sp.]|nr:ABC transporter substrate-binding protein [Rubrivivax sp.]MCA3256841.1 ABC transporter substrate-binding protein [Rubrivivax sp.]MCE2913850.1 ABC transporter substrate-binding protein [Rubrivivax sp.]MCZ8029729.1 ABC transporter substrate-binding protein [Rubrivivax sp.]